MRLILVHNPTAGSGRHSSDELRATLRAAGYDVAYASTKEGDVARALDRPAELVLAAGGDGTVGEVAKCLVGRDVPLVILPLGTANNIARSVGEERAPRDILAALGADRLALASRRRLSVGTARAAWGTTRFVESAGVGLVAALLRDAAAAERAEGAGDDDTVGEGRARLRRVLGRTPSRHWRVDADGDDVSGEYAMVEVVSTRSIGPRVALAPAADADDALLRLVVVRDEDRSALDAYLARGADDVDRPAPLRTRAVRRVRLEWPPDLGHVDDEPWPEDARASATAELAIDDPPLAVLVPADA